MQAWQRDKKMEGVVEEKNVNSREVVEINNSNISQEFIGEGKIFGFEG